MNLNNCVHIAVHLWNRRIKQEFLGGFHLDNHSLSSSLDRLTDPPGKHPPQHQVHVACIQGSGSFVLQQRIGMRWVPHPSGAAHYGATDHPHRAC